MRGSYLSSGIFLGSKGRKLSTVAANTRQMSLPWRDIFHIERSTKTALE